MLERIDAKWKEKSTITVQVSIPLLVWEEWNKDCEARFGGARYLKMMHDHEIANGLSHTVNLMANELLEIKNKIEEMEK